MSVKGHAFELFGYEVIRKARESDFEFRGFFAESRLLIGPGSHKTHTTLILTIREDYDETCLVEFSNEEYRCPVTSVKYVDLAIKK